MHKLLCLIALISPTVIADGFREDTDIKLYLTSAAINVLDELVPLLPFEASGHTACYITTAANLEGAPPWMEDEIDAAKQVGFDIRRVDLAKLSVDALPDSFADCDIFWVGGGNTYYLLQEVRRSGFDDFIIDRITAGVPYVGTSAGSLILAPDIECIKYAEEHPDFESSLESYNALNVFPLVPFVHFDNPDFKEVYRKIVLDALENDVAFVTLRDNQFIFVDGKNWRIISSD
jgi:dipeptidase E